MKVQENRVRRMAERYGYRLEKSRRRDPDALSFGLYWLRDVQINAIQFGIGPTGEQDASLEECEAWLRAD